MNKNYSILTNFGCHWRCPYCIVKKTGIDVEETNVKKVMDTLYPLIKEKKIDFLSLSGGGDPLFRADEVRLNWYRELSHLCKTNKIRFELHTSYIQSRLNKYTVSFDTIVYHCLSIEQLQKIKRVDNEVIRVVFVVQDFFTEEYVESIANFVKNSPLIEELSFRQRMDENFKETFTLHNFLIESHQDKWWYIQQDDYNNYIVNNQIVQKYESLRLKKVDFSNT